MKYQLRRLGRKSKLYDLPFSREDENEWMVGRGSLCAIITESKYASRKHFSIIQRNQDFFIYDHGSANGTYVNDLKIEPRKECQLSLDTIISVGVPSSAADQPDCIVFVFERCEKEENYGDVVASGTEKGGSRSHTTSHQKICSTCGHENVEVIEKLEKEKEESRAGSKLEEINEPNSESLDKSMPPSKSRALECRRKIERMCISEERISLFPDADSRDVQENPLHDNRQKSDSRQSGGFYRFLTESRKRSMTDNKISYSGSLNGENLPCQDRSVHEMNVINVKMEGIGAETDTTHMKDPGNCHAVKMEVGISEEANYPVVKSEQPDCNYENQCNSYGAYNMCGLEVDLFEVDDTVTEELERAYAAETQVDPDEANLSQLSFSVTEQPIEVITTNDDDEAERVKMKPSVSSLTMKMEPQFDDDGNDYDDVIYLGNIFKSDSENHFFRPEPSKKVDDDDYTETDKKWMGKLFKTKEECDSFIMSQRENDEEDRIEEDEGDDDVTILGAGYDDDIEVIVPDEPEEAKDVANEVDGEWNKPEPEKEEKDGQEMEVEDDEAMVTRDQKEEEGDRSKVPASNGKSAESGFDYLIGVITVAQGSKNMPRPVAEAPAKTDSRPVSPPKASSGVSKDEEDWKNTKKKLEELFGDNVSDKDVPPPKKFRLDYTIPKKHNVPKEPRPGMRFVKKGDVPGSYTRESLGSSRKRKRKRRKSITTNLPRAELERIKDERKQRLKELSTRNSSTRTAQDSAPKPLPSLKIKITHRNRSEFLCEGLHDPKGEKTAVDKTIHVTRVEVPKNDECSTINALSDVNINVNHTVPKSQVGAELDKDSQVSKENIPLDEVRPPLCRSASPNWTNFRVIIHEDTKVTLKSCLKSGYAFMKTYKPVHARNSVRFDKAPRIRYYVTENKMTRKTSTIHSGQSREAEEVEHLKIEDVIYDICSWNTLWLEEAKKVQEGVLPPAFQGNKLKFVQNTFRRSKDYVDSFIPLLLLELWHVISEKWKSTDCSSMRFPALCTSYENPAQGMRASMARIKCESLVLESNMICSQIREGDLVIVQLSQASPTTDCSPGSNRKLVYRIFGYLERYALLRFDSRTNQSRRGQSSEMCQMTMDILVKRRPEVVFNDETNVEIIPIHHITTNLLLCQAVCTLYKSPLCKMILNPNGGDMTLSPSLKNENVIFNGPLDSQQEELVLKLVSSCISRERSIFGVQGGPGTGKTHVILAFILQLLYTKQWKGAVRPKIVYCAHSNIVVDDVALKLKNLRQTFNQSERFKLVRFGRLNTMKVAVRDISSQHLALQNEHNNIVARKVKYLDNKINFLAWDLSKTDQNGEAEIEEKSMKLHELVKERQTVQNSKPVIAAGQRPTSTAENLILANADVICTTCSFSGAKRLVTLFEEMKSKAPNEKIICIIDEAMHSKESETIVPLQLGVTHLILFGDSQQLRSPVISERAQSLGVNRSLFWRILSIFHKKRIGVTPIYTLRTQYRMCQEISFFPNKMFYQSCLKDGRGSGARTPSSLKDYVFLLYSSSPVGSPVEIDAEMNDVALSIIDAVLNEMAKEGATCHIAVITCFVNRANALRTEFAGRSWQSNQITLEFTSIDQAQGQEFDIVLFLFDPNMNCSPLANVALTRARCSLLILTSDPAYKSNKLLVKLKEEAAMRNTYVCIHSKMTSTQVKGIILKRT